MTEAVEITDVVILSFPLYWDSLPSHLIEALERLDAHRKEIESKKGQRFYVIVNNGFPETWHNEVSINMCRLFAKEAGFKWQDALNMGGGATIGEKPLEETGGMTLRLRATLEMAAAAMAKGEPIPKEVERRFGKQLYPSWVALLTNFVWRRQAKRNGLKYPLRARPYEQE